MQSIFDIVIALIQEGYLGVFIACFIINMIPFLSPSNMVLAGVAALALPFLNPIIIGIIVAVSATLAKGIHYYAIRASRIVLSEERIAALDKEKRRVDKWGAIALFVAAASPVPDDPLIVYIGLTKYNVPKFIGSYFIGKVIVTLAGALIGHAAALQFESAPIVLLSVALTALITGILFKRKTEGKESDLLQEILEESVSSDNGQVKEPPTDEDDQAE